VASAEHRPGDRVGRPVRPGSPLVLVEDVALRLASAAGSVDILRGISLTIEPGETVALVGPSGSGKSSLMMVLAGLERPSAGRVRLAGHDLGGLDENALARLRRTHVGVVFQSFHLLPTMTALENVAIPLELAGRRDAMAAAEAALARIGLGHRVGHYPGQLSGGEQQRVAIARAFVAGPALLLADEPTGNLDGATGSAVIDCLFDEHVRLGSALLLITHDASLAERCERRLHLADGRIVGDERTAAGGARATGRGL
jgi:putative ABC transport system ATP-binding protein